MASLLSPPHGCLCRPAHSQPIVWPPHGDEKSTGRRPSRERARESEEEGQRQREGSGEKEVD
eukprot:767471-Hanusia_phi.AAC.6